MTLDEINKWLIVWIEDIYHNEVQWEGMVNSPRQALLDNRQFHAPIPPPCEADLREAVSLTLETTNNRHGLRYLNLFFRSPETTAMVGGKTIKLRIRIYDHDISKARAEISKGRWVDAYNTRPGLEGVSLEAWEVLNAACLARGLKIHRISRPVVVSAVQRISNRIKELRDGGAAFTLNIKSDVAAILSELQAHSTTSTENADVANPERSEQETKTAFRSGMKIGPYDD